MSACLSTCTTQSVMHVQYTLFVCSCVSSVDMDYCMLYCSQQLDYKGQPLDN